jgi:hypothetical protein
MTVLEEWWFHLSALLSADNPVSDTAVSNLLFSYCEYITEYYSEVLGAVLEEGKAKKVIDDKTR